MRLVDFTYPIICSNELINEKKVYACTDASIFDTTYQLPGFFFSIMMKGGTQFVLSKNFHAGFRFTRSSFL